MSTVFIARRDLQRTRQAQAQIEASRDLQVLGVAHTLDGARRESPPRDPDALLIDLRLHDGLAQTLVRELRDRGAERPKVMVVAPDAVDPLLFQTLVAGADAYLLEADLAAAPSLIKRMLAGEATMAAPIAARALQFFNEPAQSPAGAAAPNERALDWSSHAANPLRLSPGERRLLQLLAQGVRSAEVCTRTALSLEGLGRRIGNLYRKLSWDIRSGSLALQAA
jgi:DNA-binding NarL/FixJ family response regulator